MSYKADGRIREKASPPGVVKSTIRPESNASPSEHVVAAPAGHVPTRTNMEQTLSACASDQPLQNSIEIGFFLRADAVAAHLPVRHCLQVQRVDELIHRKLVGKVRFVAED